MMQNLIRALRAMVVLAVLTGLAYPLVMTGYRPGGDGGQGRRIARHADGRVGRQLARSASSGTGRTGSTAVLPPSTTTPRPPRAPTSAPTPRSSPTSSRSALEPSCARGPVRPGPDGGRHPGRPRSPPRPADSTPTSRSPPRSSRRRGSPRSAACPLDQVIALIDEHTDGAGPRVPRRAARERPRTQPRPAAIGEADDGPDRHPPAAGCSSWVEVDAVLDAAEVATRAAADDRQLVLLSLGYPVSPEQDAVVQAALREAADQQSGSMPSSFRHRSDSASTSTPGTRSHSSPSGLRADGSSNAPWRIRAQRNVSTSHIHRPGSDSGGARHGSAAVASDRS